ncbi:translocation/assembly module TamB domain-containing protein [Natronohydrobacter thiooxidans]|uniref:translocation/assembly module TamB domain-containing protein n=1 Tax=Natronohydrobacter thiooxidans TaxID=87172 RepID=UPI0009FCA0DB|nr:translocation/assembly module TamB domain-containing protein [Natronohydrobacter thiooxidans]
MRLLRLLPALLLGLMLGFAPAAQAQDFEELLPRADESDAGYLTRLLQDSLSGAGREVRLGGFRGALSSRATFDELSIEDEIGVWMLIEDAALQWNRAALFQRRIEIAEISARRVTILRAPVSDEPSDELFTLPRLELPELPVSVNLDQMQIDEVILGPDVLGEPLRASIRGNAALADGEGTASLRIERIDEIDGLIRLDAGFSNATRILSVDLSAEEAAGGLAVSLLGIPDAPSAALTIAGEGPVSDFTADITLATDGVPRVEGEFQLQTALQDVAQAVRLDLSGDLRPLMDPEFHPFFGPQSRLRTQARRFEDGRLRLDDLDIQTQRLALSGRFYLGADRLPELIDLRGQVEDPAGERVLLPVPGGRTTIESANLRLGFDASVNEDWDLVLDLLGFENEDFTVESLFVNGIGRITSDGFGEDIDVIDALIDFSALGLAAADPGLNAALGNSVTGSASLLWREGRPLLLPGFLLEGRDYALNGRARLEDGVIFANAQGQFRDVSRLSTLAGRPLSGAVTAEVDATIGPERDRFMVAAEISGQDLTLDQAQLDALLSGRSQITIDAHSADGTISLRRLQAEARTLRSDLRGTITGSEIDLRGEVDFADIAVLGNGFGGALDAQIALRGPREAERLTLEAVARDLTVGQEDVNRLLRGETTLALDGQRDGTAFDLTSLSLSNNAIEASAEGRYDPGASRLELRATLPNLSAIRPGLGGRITAEASLREEGETRHLALDAVANNLRLGAPTADNLLTGTHRLNARVVQRPDEILLETLTLAGSQLNGTVTGRIADGRPELQIDARLNNLAVLVPGITGALSVSGSARDTDGAYALDLGVSGPAGLTAQVSGSIASDLTGDLRATGSTDLALINPRLEPRSIQGPARFDVTLSGPLALSSLRGTAEASDVTLVLPRNNLRITDIVASAQLDGPRSTVTVRGRAATGGSVALDGTIGLGAPITGDLRASLNELRIVNPQLFDTTVSGDVAITGNLTQGPDITGALSLDRTEIRIPRVGLAGRGYIPPNITHQGDAAAVRATRDRAGIFAGETFGRRPNPARLDISVDAPNRIFIRGRGLDAELGGTLRLTGTTADLIPIGQFGLIRGRLDLLGNRFNLNEGFASLEGDFVPYVRLVASTERSGVLARIVLEGRVDAPEIRFESVPELPEEEIVSLLLFGRGFESLSLLQAAQLASSIATLSGRGEGIFERLRQNIGLDDLDVRTDEDGETSIRLGRYLTENIYTDVEVSPQGSSEVSINIDLSPSLTARGRVDNQGRASVGLFFERDY